jgi:hypothetical protein
MANTGRKIKIILYKGIFAFLLLYFLWQVVLHPLIDRFIPLGPIFTDVAKRIESPDGKRMALLIRRNAWHLGFGIKIQESIFKSKYLLYTNHFDPDMRADWNEKIIWSDDSSFIVLTVDRPADELDRRYAETEPNYFGTIYYAYDFKDGKKYKPDDKNTIISIMNSRCKEPKLEMQTSDVNER